MNKNTKIVIMIILAIMLLSGGLLFYRYLSASSMGSKSKAETAQQQAQNNQKKSTTNDTSKGSGQGTYTPPANSTGIDFTANQTSSSQVVVTTKLTGYSDGICTLTSTNGSKTNTQNAQVIYQSEFSTCAGFTVPVATLGAGDWTLILTVTSGGITNQKSTTITVQ